MYCQKSKSTHLLTCLLASVAKGGYPLQPCKSIHVHTSICWSYPCPHLFQSCRFYAAPEQLATLMRTVTLQLIVAIRAYMNGPGRLWDQDKPLLIANLCAIARLRDVFVSSIRYMPNSFLILELEWDVFDLCEAQSVHWAIGSFVWNALCQAVASGANGHPGGCAPRRRWSSNTCSDGHFCEQM